MRVASGKVTKITKNSNNIEVNLLSSKNDNEETIYQVSELLYL